MLGPCKTETLHQAFFVAHPTKREMRNRLRKASRLVTVSMRIYIERPEQVAIYLALLIAITRSKMAGRAGGRKCLLTPRPQRPRRKVSSRRSAAAVRGNRDGPGKTKIHRTPDSSPLSCGNPGGTRPIQALFRAGLAWRTPGFRANDDPRVPSPSRMGQEPPNLYEPASIHF